MIIRPVNLIKIKENDIKIFFSIKFTSNLYIKYFTIIKVQILLFHII